MLLMFIFDYVHVSWNKNSLSFDKYFWSEMKDTDKWQLHNYFWSIFAKYSMTCQLLVVFLFSTSLLAHFLKQTTLWNSRFVGFKIFQILISGCWYFKSAQNIACYSGKAIFVLFQLGFFWMLAVLACNKS